MLLLLHLGTGDPQSLCCLPCVGLHTPGDRVIQSAPALDGGADEKTKNRPAGCDERAQSDEREPSVRACVPTRTARGRGRCRSGSLRARRRNRRRASATSSGPSTPRERCGRRVAARVWRAPRGTGPGQTLGDPPRASLPSRASCSPILSPSIGISTAIPLCCSRSARNSR